MTDPWMIYGANGYTGRLCAQLAKSRGLAPLLAGRNIEQVAPLARELGLEARVFDLADPEAVTRGLAGMKAVLHCAGPFSATAKPMLAGCVVTGTHYLDITGEIAVFEDIHGRNAEFETAGIAAIPGVGFDVVPTDCLALHLKQRLPSATHLTLAFRTQGPAGLPPGTQRTMIEMMPFGNRVRLNGKLETPRRAPVTRQVDFGKGPVQVTRLTWGMFSLPFTAPAFPTSKTTSFFRKRRVSSWLCSIDCGLC